MRIDVSVAAPPQLAMVRLRHWLRKGAVGAARVEEEQRVVSQGGGGRGRERRRMGIALFDWQWWVRERERDRARRRESE